MSPLPARPTLRRFRYPHRSVGMAAAAAVLGLLLAGAGCSGPEAPVRIGVKDVPTDVIIGPPDPVDPAAPSPPTSTTLVGP